MSFKTMKLEPIEHLSSERSIHETVSDLVEECHRLQTVQAVRELTPAIAAQLLLEIKPLVDRAKALESELKCYLREHVAGGSRLESPEGFVKVQRAGLRFRLTSAERTPEQFIVYQPKPNVTTIRSHYEATSEVPSGVECYTATPAVILRLRS